LRPLIAGIVSVFVGIERAVGAVFEPRPLQTRYGVVGGW
jgi:hypothetical protein